jgi:D-serine dehydratase
VDSLVGMSLSAAEVPLPALALKESALDGNINAISDFCAAHTVSIAPHAKTHMIQEVVDRQMSAGAWGITVATVGQAEVVAEWGVGKLLIANEIVGGASLRLLGRLRDRHPGGEFLVLVDSLVGVELLRRRFFDTNSPLSVLLEVGLGGRRAGVRSSEAAMEVALAVHTSPGLRLVGVEMYEGAVALDRSDESIGRVDAALAETAELVRQLAEAGLFPIGERVIVSAGGSVFFDRVVRVLRLPRERFEILLRCGANAFHDDGHYKHLSPLHLSPALHVWADVLSVPEPTLAIIGMGKRDAPYDLGLPVPKSIFRNGVAVELPDECKVVDTNDHHAFMRTSHDAVVPGDVIVFGVSHPCTTFDKWSQTLLVDDSNRVLSTLNTHF